MKSWNKYSKTVLLVSLAILVIASFVNVPRTYRIFHAGDALHLSGQVVAQRVTYQTFFYILALGFASVSMKVVATFIANYTIVTLFGYMLSFAFLSRLNLSLTVQLLASFVIGYMGIIPVIRVCSLLFSYDQIYLPVLIVIVAFTLYQMYQRRLQLREMLFNKLSPAERKQNYILYTLLSILFLSALLIQAFQYDFVMFGHANISPFLDKWKYDGTLHFPIITQHYEDLITHYFFTIPIDVKLTTIIPWWFTLGLLKVSVVALLYSLFRRMGVSFYFSLVACAYLMIGTTSIVASKYYLHFEYANPLFFIAVSGRLVAIASFILLIILGVDDESENIISRLFLALLAIGLTSVTMPGVVWVVAFFVLARFFKMYHSLAGVLSEKREKLELLAGNIFIYSTVIITLALYGLPYNLTWAHNLRFLLVLLIILAITFLALQRLYVVILSRYQVKKFNSALNSIAYLALPAVVGLLFFGNLFALNGMSEWFYQAISPLVGEINFSALTPSYVDPGSFALGDFRSQGGNSHSKGFFQFATNYGGLLAMMLISNYLFNTIRSEANTRDKALYEVFLVAAGFVSIFLWFTDFVGFFKENSWNKTRVIELPYYFVIFYFLYILYRALNARFRIVAAAVLIFYAVTPFVAMERHKQIFYNWKLIKYLNTLKE